MNWTRELASKYNIFPNKPGYIPILIENIPVYAAQSNFLSTCIQEVEVVGEVIVKKEQVLLRTLSEQSVAVIKLSLNTLRNKEELPKELDDIGTLHPQLIRNEVVRLKGEIKVNKDEAFLEVHEIIKVQDPIGSHQTIALLSEVVQQHHEQYKSCPQNVLQPHWQRMGENGLRIINVNKKK